MGRRLCQKRKCIGHAAKTLFLSFFAVDLSRRSAATELLSGGGAFLGRDSRLWIGSDAIIFSCSISDPVFLPGSAPIPILQIGSDHP